MSVAKIGMTIEEAAEMSGIGRNTMRALVDWGKLPVLKVGGNLQIVLINIKAINISGLTNLRAKVGKNRSRLFWQSGNPANIHGSFLRQGKNIGFLIGGEKSIQRQRNNCINITLFEDKIS